MKARVKATGEIVEVEATFVDGDKIYRWVTNNGYFYSFESLDFEGLELGVIDVKEKSFPKDEPDYWDKLKHQYAGQFLQGILIGKTFARDYVEEAYNYATALVNRLKSEQL